MSDKLEQNMIPDSDTLESEAASWIAQLDAGPMQDADRQAMREWAARSPRHLQELRKFAALWGDIDVIAAMEQPAASFSFGSFTGSAFRLRPQLAVRAFAVTAVVLIFGITMTMLPLTSVPGDAPEAFYSADKGENRVVELADGSTMQLNTDSVAEVQYSDAKRVIRLLKGEGYFDVAPDRNRPFEVYAGGNLVRAVGTEFEVQISDGETSVLVTEGKVEFRPLRTEAVREGSVLADLAPRLIVAGQHASISRKASAIKEITKQDVEKQLSWRQGLLVFEGDTLEHVVKEVARYTDTTFVISDPNIRDLKVGGVFKTGEVATLLMALEQSFDLSIERVDANTVYLSAAVQLDDENLTSESFDENLLGDN